MKELNLMLPFDLDGSPLRYYMGTESITDALLSHELELLEKALTPLNKSENKVIGSINTYALATKLRKSESLKRLFYSLPEKQMCWVHENNLSFSTHYLLAYLMLSQLADLKVLATIDTLEDSGSEAVDAWNIRKSVESFYADIVSDKIRENVLEPVSKDFNYTILHSISPTHFTRYDDGVLTLVYLARAVYGEQKFTEYMLKRAELAPNSSYVAMIRYLKNPGKYADYPLDWALECEEEILEEISVCRFSEGNSASNYTLTVQ